MDNSYLFYRIIKRGMDLVLSVILIFFSLPFVFIVVLLLKLTSNGSVIFKQERVGLEGKRFVLYKFRSMVSGAEQERRELFERNMMLGPAFKIQNDPRITLIGRYLRGSSFDELPQLWNVLKGEMSLVGPRPPLPEEASQYNVWHRQRLTVKPGLTCIWQIRGRSRIASFEEWLRLDIEYIQNRSLWLDLLIILKTIPVVMLRVGAW
jgi:lipopolysaccharide/colanic/teichoic acid biosynthesis glycosyltransferase